MTLTARFQISIWSQLTKKLNRKENKAYAIFLQFQEQQRCINLFDGSCGDFNEEQMQKIENETFFSESTNRNFRKKKTKSCNYRGNDIPLESTLLSFSEISNKLHKTRVLKERQNKKYESSLDTDRKKMKKEKLPKKGWKLI